MRATIAMRLGVAGTLLVGAALPASAQQPGESESIPISVCVIPLAAAGLGGAGVDDPNLPSTAIGSGTNICTFSQQQQIINLRCSTLLENYTAGRFRGTVRCDLLDCQGGIIRVNNGVVNISTSGNATLDCEVRRR